MLRCRAERGLWCGGEREPRIPDHAAIIGGARNQVEEGAHRLGISGLADQTSEDGREGRTETRGDRSLGFAEIPGGAREELRRHEALEAIE